MIMQSETRINRLKRPIWFCTGPIKRPGYFLCRRKLVFLCRSEPYQRTGSRTGALYHTVLYRNIAAYYIMSTRNRINRRTETRFKPHLLSNDKLYHNDTKTVKYGLSRCKNGIYPLYYHMFRAEKAARHRSIKCRAPRRGPDPGRIWSGFRSSQCCLIPFWAFLRDFFLRFFCDKTFLSAWNHIFLHQLGYNLKGPSRICTL